MKKRIENGIYLVIDPSMEEEILLERIEIVLQEKIVALQIWDNFPKNIKVESLITKICGICQSFGVPVLINNHWELLAHLPLDGVHFDRRPENYEKIKTVLNKPFISGLTCNNDFADIHWAVKSKLDYISFCSVFHSNTSSSCELVSFETIRKAIEIADFPIFLAGGIRPENMKELRDLNYDGIAVVSGVMNVEDPKEAVRKYLIELNHL
ncbi:MAG: thiamine phosphate synthase [Brumimicrobium sp.]|nr:thiamine phosphate synthase [Brumimicrobium sp.]